MAKRIGISFIVSLSALIGLLLLSTLIPKSWIRDNLLASAEYLEEKEDNYYFLIEGKPNTILHNYADAITMNIMYSMEGDLLSGEAFLDYFYSGGQDTSFPMIRNLKELIEEDKGVDTVYDRYWHGMIIYLRVLMVFLDIRGVRIFSAILLFGLLAWLSVLLWKKKQRTFAVSLWIAGFFVALPVVPLCMEYFSNWPIALMASVWVARGQRSYKDMMGLMAITGVSCAFFDFLTTETIVFVLPMAVWYVLREEKMQKPGKELLDCFYAGLCWLLSYCLTYLIKWSIASVLEGKNRFGEAIEVAGRWVGGDAVSTLGNTASGLDNQMLLAITENVKELTGIDLYFPSNTMLVLLLVFVFALFSFLFLFRKKKEEFTLGGMLLLLALVPIGRFLVMNGHSVAHIFFTYRALYVTILCLIVGISKATDLTLLIRKSPQRSRTRRK